MGKCCSVSHIANARQTACLANAIFNCISNLNRTSHAEIQKWHTHNSNVLAVHEMRERDMSANVLAGRPDSDIRILRTVRNREWIALVGTALRCRTVANLSIFCQRIEKVL